MCFTGLLAVSLVDMEVKCEEEEAVDASCLHLSFSGPLPRTVTCISVP